MRRIPFWLFLVLAILFSFAAAAAAEAPAAAAKAVAAKAAGGQKGEAATTFVRLKNGLGVLVREDDRFPLVHVRILVHAGSAYETPAQAGISHVLEHMVFKGAGDMGPGEVARRIEAVGGSLNAATSFDDTVFHVEVPDTAWKLGLHVVSAMVFQPRLLPEQLKSEKEVVLAELKRDEDEPSFMIFQAAQDMVWAGTTYARPVIGYRKNVRAVTSASLRAYRAPLYQPQNMLLCVVGRVKAADVVAEAERTLGGIRNTARIIPPRPFVLRTGGGPRIRIVPSKWKKAYIALAFPAPDFLSGKMAGLDVLAQILGGDETSRLYRSLKYEKRLVDSVGVDDSNLQRAGMLMVTAAVDPDKIPAALNAMTEQLAAFKPQDITDRELARARTNIEAGVFLARETISGLASRLTQEYAFEGGPQNEANYLSAVGHISRPQLGALYREFFRPERMSIVVLAPKGTKISGAKLLGDVEKRWPVRTEAAEAAKKAPDHVRRVALPGGSTLLLLPDSTLPYTAVSVAWPGGDGLLKPDEQGLATLTASLLMRGTAQLPAPAFADFLSDRAASMGAASHSETFGVSAKFPSRYGKDMFGLLRGVLTAPAFAAAETARAREDQLAAIRRAEDLPLGLLFRNLPQTLFTSAPQDLQRLGRPDLVRGFTSAQARAFWAKQSHEPFVLSVCGEYDEAQLIAFAKDLARALAPAAGTRPYASRVPAWKPQATKELTLKGRNQAHLLVIFKTPGLLDREATARLSVLRAALAGQSGILFSGMRDKQGLGYTVTAFLSQYEKGGMFAFYIGTDPDKLPKALAGFRKAAASIAAKPLPAAELARAKNVLAGEYYQDRQALLARSGEAAAALVRGLPRDADLKLVERERTVTAEEVRREAAEILKWDRAYVMEVHP